MDKQCSQGRIKILSYTKSCLDLIFTWPNANSIIDDDPNLLLDLAIVWFCVANNKVEPDQWTLALALELSKEWLKIHTNSLVDATVKTYTLKFLANLLNIFWSENLNIDIIRQFKLVLRKAASDYECTTVAGFLKLAVIKETTRPEVLFFNGTTRKTPAAHFACSIFILHRSRASSLDIENFFTALNENGGNEIKVIY